MSTKLKGLYKSLKFFSVATQKSMCADLTRGPRRLANCFAIALEQNSPFDNRNHPFLNQAAIDARGIIGPDDNNENRVIARLRGREDIGVDQGPGGYRFRYVEREVPPFGVSGSIDYIARTGTTPILGEVKWKSDQNAFYAFIQLLVYLSEMATPNQTKRANIHETFGVAIGDHPSFDLHILLSDRNPRSETVRLIEPTRLLACSFRRELQLRHPQAAQAVGRILCLEMNTAHFHMNGDNGIICRWCDEQAAQPRLLMP